jgi:glycosyltransferase involved in cell wall biosynthesis
VFPNDPLYRSFRKGEVKLRYFNPCDFFNEIHVLSFSNYDINAKKVQKLAGKGRLFIHPVGRLSYARMPFILLKVLLLLKRLRPSVIRAYNPLHGFIGVMLGRLLGIPTVISLHGDYDEERYFRKKLYGKGSLPRNIVERITEKIALSLADCVLCVSHFVKKYALRYGAKNPTVLYNKVDLTLFKPDLDTRSFRRQLGLENKRVLLYVGRVDKQKNVACLIKTIKELVDMSLSNVHLIVVGTGPEVEELKKLALQLGVQDKITFTGPVPHEKLPPYYSTADIYVHASFFEGFGIPLIEAMSSGKPIVAAEVGPIPEIVEDAGILISRMDPRLFAKAIVKLQDENLRTEISKKARMKAAKYDSRALEEQEARIYSSILKRNK